MIDFELTKLLKTERARLAAPHKAQSNPLAHFTEHQVVTDYQIQEMCKLNSLATQDDLHRIMAMRSDQAWEWWMKTFGSAILATIQAHQTGQMCKAR